MKINWISLIEGKGGKLSAMRLGFLFALVMVLGNWTWANFHKKSELVPLPENSVALIIGLAGAKAVQRFGEKSVTTTISSDTTTVKTT